MEFELVVKHTFLEFIAVARLTLDGWGGSVAGGVSELLRTASATIPLMADGVSHRFLLRVQVSISCVARVLDAKPYIHAIHKYGSRVEQGQILVRS